MGKSKKIISFIFMFLLIILVGCGAKEEVDTAPEELSENQIFIYYVNNNKTDMVQSVYTLDKGNDLNQNVNDLIKHLSNMEATVDCQSPIPDSFVYVENPVENVRGRIEISFNVVYDNVSAESLLFFKGCVARTLLQLEGVDKLTIYMTDVANTDPETATVSETFDEDSFTLSFGDTSGNKQKGNIVLYFANESGTALKSYRKSIEITNNMSLGRMVIEALIEGPKRDGYMATISADTTIKSIAVKDGICYIDLSDEFYNTDNELKNDIIVYSIVNSLVELPTVTKVQFLKDGEKIPFYRETMPIDGLLERNLDIVEQEGI